MVLKSFLVLLGCVWLAFAQIPTNGLVAYYPFNGNANDASGNGNNGSVTGVTLTKDRFSNSNSAYSFNGKNNHITVADNSSLSPNALSISFWVNATQFCPTGSTLCDLISKDINPKSRQWTSQLLQNGKIRTATFTTTENTFDSDISITLNTWYHIVRVWDGTTCSIYINNVLHGSMAMTGNMRTGSAPVEIGGSNSQYFQGKLDDIRIYNRALTSSEIAALYNENSLSSGIIAYFPFNGNANDASGNGNNGTVTGATLSPDRFSNSNSAYSFNGVNNHITVANNSSLAPNALSISFWVNATQFCPSGSTLCDLISKDINPTSRQWTSQLLQNGKIRTATFTAKENTFDSDIPITLNTWYHIVRVWDGMTCSIYINNVLHGSMATSGNLRAGSAPVEIGGSNSQYFQGKLDDIRIYNRALTSSEIAALYSEGSPVKIAQPSFLHYNSRLNTLIFPNPFNAATTITYSVPSTSHLDISIYNANGKLVRNIFSGLRQAGVYNYFWDGKNLSGAQVANGNYFFSVKASNGEQVLDKIVVIK
jgi:hypothetical protein